ncbi:hypothetical protein FRC04_008832 [Tulasnella sp. 424]|nr:hypothetical protein FRC04_008832 [Tulasnella sp. 424]KAG8980059.1 hypothetical protein FRC05_007502 [Tulasnella sp. 425]
MANYTTQLPPETWLVVMDFLADNLKLPEHNFSSGNNGIILQSSPHIRTVSTLSRFFNRLANPYRFRSANLHVSESPVTLRRIEEFLDLLERRPEVKTWVRILSIGRTSGSLVDLLQSVEKHLAVEARVHEVVPELRNLSTLRCGSMAFSSSLFFGVLQLPRLERLELQRFQLSESTSEHTTDWSIVDQKNSSLRSLVVTSLTLGPPAIQSAAALTHLLRQETLAELIHEPLIMHSSPSHQKRATLLEVISTHIPEYVFEGLRRLAIRLSSADAEAQRFVDLGARCPNLTTLSLKSWNIGSPIDGLEDAIKRSGVTSHHFPALQRFEGHLLLAPIFTKGRPVHTVVGEVLTRHHPLTLTAHETKLAPTVAALKPSVPLRVLHLRVMQWNDGDFEAVAQHHPKLEELVYKSFGGENIRWSLQLEEAFRKFSDLKRITLTTNVLMDDVSTRNVIEDDHHMITNLRSSCPSLQQAVIFGLGTWRLRPEYKVR